MLVPTFKFHGSKCRIAKYIFADVGNCRHYYEPFAGRGNSFFWYVSHRKYQKAWLNDLQLSGFLIALRDYAGDYSFVPEYVDRGTYNRFYKLECCSERYLAESFCAYNGTFWGGGANITSSPGRPSANKHSRQNTILRFKKARDLLDGVHISGLDYLEFMGGMQLDKEDLIYLDPPYWNQSNSKVGPNIDHEQLALAILDLPCKVLLSGYHTPVYDRVLSNFRKFSFERASCGRNSNGQSHTAVETVWTNC